MEVKAASEMEPRPEQYHFVFHDGNSYNKL